MASHQYLFCLVLLIVFLNGCSSSWNVNNEKFLPSSSPTPNSLNVKFLGVSNVYLHDGSTSILIDGFLSRRGFSALIHGMNTDKEVVLNTLKKSNIHSLNALLVAHSHYDHALDAKFIADLKQSRIYGSEMSNEVIDSNLFTVVNDGDSYTVGRFKVTFIETPHVDKSKFLRFLESAVTLATRGTRFKKIDKNFSFYIEHELGNVLIVPSANYKPNQFDKLRANIVFLGIGLLGNQSIEYIDRYWIETIEKTKANIVVPVHWDSFNKPLDDGLVGVSDLVDDLPRTMSILRRKADENPKVELLFMHPMKNTNLTTNSGFLRVD
jgi:L-ascorbate metabolism protein UlaG (beta-lactamase superfamily)